MFPYLIAFISSSMLLYFSDHQGKRIRKFLVINALLILIILAALRGESIGTDVLYYGKVIFDTSKTINSWDSFIKICTLYDIEFGYVLLNIIVSHIFGDLQWLLFFIEAITVFFMYKAIEIVPYKEKWQLMLIFDLLFYNQTLNNLRQFMAMSLALYVFCSFVFLGKKKSVLWLLVAALFHRTALVVVGYLILFQLYKKKSIRKIRFVLYLGIIGLQVGFSYFMSIIDSFGILGVKYAGHMNDTLLSTVDTNLYLIAFQVLPLVLTVCLMIYFKGVKKNGSDNNILITISFVSIVFSIIYRSQFIERLIWYSNYISYLVCLPYLVNQLKNNIKSIYIFKNILLICFFVFWIINYIVMNNGETYPYIPYWG